MSDTIKREEGPVRTFETGAHRQCAAGKGLPSLFPPDAYIDICKHFEYGAVMHGDRNWEKGMTLSSYIDSVERHITAIKMGLTDEPHARAMAWNAICYLATKLRIEAKLLPASLDNIERIYQDPPVQDPTQLKAAEALRVDLGKNNMLAAGFGAASVGRSDKPELDGRNE